jgi:hypothetical protein
LQNIDEDHDYIWITIGRFVQFSLKKTTLFYLFVFDVLQPCQLIKDQKKYSCTHFFNHIYDLLIFDSLGIAIMQSSSSPLKFHFAIRQLQSQAHLFNQFDP